MELQGSYKGFFFMVNRNLAMANQSELFVTSMI